VKSPNPEEPAAFTLAFELAKQENADLIMATDPDADRIGIAVKEPSGDYRLLNGNQTGVLLTYYILSQLKENGKLPKKGVVVKTIVTTDMVLAIARDFGVEVEQTLTGFKFIGEKIHEYEETRNKTYLFGFEESYGYLAGTFVRDKDAVCAAVLAAEAAAFYKSKGKTLYAVLQELWARYGCYQESLHTITLEGKTGQEETAFLMSRVREEGFTDFAGFAISRVEDYLTGLGKNLQSGEGYQLELSKSNVVRFMLERGGFVVFRPSGTEPKAKIYFSLAGDTAEQAQGYIQQIKNSILVKVDSILEEFKNA
jgi:phosphoglucomutase